MPAETGEAAASRVRIGYTLDLDYHVRGPADFIFIIHAARTDQQRVLTEAVVVDPAVQWRVEAEPHFGNRLLRLRADAGPLHVRYMGNVEVEHVVAEPDRVVAAPLDALPVHTLPFLWSSRYCQADLVQLNECLATAPTARADAIYTGVLYDALDFATLSPAARRRATSRVAITSSLFGIVRPGDRIPAYRLSGDAALPGVGSVAGVWREVLGEAVTGAMRQGLLVDLRSSTYAAFWRPAKDLAHRVATVRVLHESDGRRTVVSHFNKATKGRIVRALLEDGANPRTPQALADTLARLGWTVEVGEPTAKGTQLDVVVTEV